MRNAECEMRNADAPRVRIIIQARMGSSRLPAKIMAPLAGEPMLVHVVRRLQAAEAYVGHDVETMVATTLQSVDDATEDLCRHLRVPCFRGPTEDVLARYVAATADLADEDVVIRATADNPLYCPLRTAKILEQHLVQRADYTCITNLSYVVPEVVRAGALRAMAQLADEPYCREHVTPYFGHSPGGFRVQQLPENWQGLRPDVRLTVDTPGEHRRMAGLFAALGAGDFSLEDVYAHCDPVTDSRLTVGPTGHARERTLTRAARWASG